MKIPEFHLEIYRWIKRGRNKNSSFISYHYLIEILKRILNRPPLYFCISTIEELQHFGLIEEISGRQRRKEYLLLNDERIKQCLTKSKEIFFRVNKIKMQLRKSAFPIDL